MTAPQFEKEIHQLYKSAERVFVGIDLFDGNLSNVLGFVNRSGVTFPVLLYGSSDASTYGLYTDSYVIVNPDGIVDYVISYYNPSSIKAALDALTHTEDRPEDKQPQRFHLEQNYPNPFNPVTRIDYSIGQNRTVPVELKVYNTKGEPVKTLVSQPQTAGQYSVTWDSIDDTGQTVAAGVYFYSLKIEEHVATKPMVLVK